VPLWFKRKIMKLQIFQVDAFTSKPFGGNPAAVVPLEAWLPDETMQAIGLENNLSETAFFVRRDDGVYELRWFTPEAEVDLCGHATLASAHVIFNELKHDGDTIRFQSMRSGELSVARDGDKLVLDFPSYTVEEIEAIDDIGDGEKPLKFYRSSSNKLVMLMPSQTSVVAFRPNFQRYMELPFGSVVVTAKGDDCDFASRMFAPKFGIPEDPVTGAMHCVLIPYWAKELGKTRLLARQVSKRGGELFCELAGERVKIGGNAVLYLKGEIYVEADKLRSAMG
jgi:PhzF family phenazine biosynthesis protein